MSEPFLPALISPLAIAPMIDWTYTHFRVFMRLLAPTSLLYTDMQTTGAILNNPTRAFNFQRMEQPLALQIGGSDRDALVRCAMMAEQQGLTEINLNLGCPSDRVQAGRFGACLMTEPRHVADCIRAMKDAVRVPVTAKLRIGIDHQDDYDFFASFAHGLVEAGCDKLIVHARKAWLHGLNPKQNRTIPPLHYDYVYRLKLTLPHLPVVINGNINDLAAINTHLNHVDGVMLGRLACQDPYAIARIHHALCPRYPLLSRASILASYIEHVLDAHQKGVAMTMLLKPLFNFAHALPGARHWKAQLMHLQQTKDSHALNALPALMSEMDA